MCKLGFGNVQHEVNSWLKHFQTPVRVCIAALQPSFFSVPVFKLQYAADGLNSNDHLCFSGFMMEHVDTLRSRCPKVIGLPEHLREMCFTFNLRDALQDLSDSWFPESLDREAMFGVAIFGRRRDEHDNMVQANMEPLYFLFTTTVVASKTIFLDEIDLDSLHMWLLQHLS